LRGIFGADLLSDATLLPILEQLTGWQPDKPFECVGTRDEVNCALCLAIERRSDADDKPLPALLAWYRQTPLYERYRNRAHSYDGFFDSRHRLPPEFLAALKDSGLVA